MNEPGRPDQPPTPTRWPHSREEAEVEDVVSALSAYRTLTRKRLVEICGARHWSDTGFRRALEKAVSTGKVRRLDDDLYEIVEPPSPSRTEQSDERA